MTRPAGPSRATPTPPRRVVLAVFAWCALAAIVPTASGHPQDGPHADIRARIGDEEVRLSVGLNLAFIDHILGVRREALGEVAPSEARIIERGLMEFLTSTNAMSINGEAVAAEVESFALHTDPDPGMAVLYPRTGMRALIRGVAILRYPAPGGVASIEYTWNAYPTDVLAEMVEPEKLAVQGVMPTMFLEAQIQTPAGVEMVRFSSAQPTVRWNADPNARADGFVDVPAPALAKADAGAPAVRRALAWVIGGVGVAAFAGASLAARGRRGALLASGLVLSLVGAGGVWASAAAGPQDAVDDAHAAEAFLALHNNLYRAFNFTAETDIYDALARTVTSDRLERLYDEVYASLVQAEQGGMLGVVAGLEHGPVEILERRGGDAPGATVRHEWTVDGVVYHWGHSHTRTNAYAGEFELAVVDGAWRLADYRILEQRRLGGEGEGSETTPSEAELLRRLSEMYRDGI